jgi:hypothetical protein
MTVRDLINELERRILDRPALAQAKVYICRESEARPLYSDDIAFTDQICDADEGEQVDGNFLELLTWS